jgi:hypothetical protein
VAAADLGHARRQVNSRTVDTVAILVSAIAGQVIIPQLCEFADSSRMQMLFIDAAFAEQRSDRCVLLALCHVARCRRVFAR